MATLNDITKKTKTLADVISKKAAKFAPKKTGTLRDALIRENNFNTMVEFGPASTQTKISKNITFTYNYAPDGAPYGMFWNDPTVSYQVRNQTTGNKDKINFAQQALNDPSIDSLFNDLSDNIAEMVANGLKDSINDLDKD